MAAGMARGGPWRRWRSAYAFEVRLFAATASLAVLGVGTFLGFGTGVLSPNLSAFPAGYTQDVRLRTASLTFDVVNDGAVPTSITGFDGGAPGLGQPEVRARSNGGGPAERLPISLASHASLVVTLLYRHIDCRSVRPLGPTLIPVHATAGLGYTTTVDLSPGTFWPAIPSGTHVATAPSERPLSWSAGITSHVCPGV